MNYMHRSLLLGTLLALSLTTVAGFARPAAGAGIDERKLTVAINNRPLRQALEDALTNTGIAYRVEADVPDPRVSLNVREVSAPVLIRLLTRTASMGMVDRRITFSLEQGVYVVQLGPAEPKLPPKALTVVDDRWRDARLERKLTLAVREEPLETVIHRAFSGSGIQYSIRPEVARIPITLSVRGTSALTVARLAMRKVAERLPGANLWRDGDIYVLGPRGTSAEPAGQP